MSGPSDSYTQHAGLFTRVYDLDDPSPYFSTLRPTGYRMPVALAGALEANPCAALCRARRGAYPEAAGLRLRIRSHRRVVAP